jgi:hypothetical protein
VGFAAAVEAADPDARLFGLVAAEILQEGLQDPTQPALVFAFANERAQLEAQGAELLGILGIRDLGDAFIRAR